MKLWGWISYYWIDLLIIGVGYAGLGWLFYCAATGTDPVGWFRGVV